MYNYRIMDSHNSRTLASTARLRFQFVLACIGMGFAAFGIGGLVWFTIWP